MSSLQVWNINFVCISVIAIRLCYYSHYSNVGQKLACIVFLWFSKMNEKFSKCTYTKRFYTYFVLSLLSYLPLTMRSPDSITVFFFSNCGPNLLTWGLNVFFK